MSVLFIVLRASVEHVSIVPNPCLQVLDAVLQGRDNGLMKGFPVFDCCDQTLHDGVEGDGIDVIMLEDCYDPGPTKFSSPSQQPPSSHSTTHIPTLPASIVRPLMPRPPLPQQPPPQFYYQQYQMPSSWDNQTSAPHQPEEEPLIDLSPDTDHEMTPPDDPVPLAPFTPLADPLIPTPMEHEPAPTIMM